MSEWSVMEQVVITGHYAESYCSAPVIRNTKGLLLDQKIKDQVTTGANNTVYKRNY